MRRTPHADRSPGCAVGSSHTLGSFTCPHRRGGPNASGTCCESPGCATPSEALPVHIVEAALTRAEPVARALAALGALGTFRALPRLPAPRGGSTDARSRRHEREPASARRRRRARRLTTAAARVVGHRDPTVRLAGVVIAAVSTAFGRRAGLTGALAVTGRLRRLALGASAGGAGGAGGGEAAGLGIISVAASLAGALAGAGVSCCRSRVGKRKTRHKLRR